MTVTVAEGPILSAVDSGQQRWCAECVGCDWRREGTYEEARDGFFCHVDDHDRREREALAVMNDIVDRLVDTIGVGADISTFFRLLADMCDKRNVATSREGKHG